MDFSSLNTFRKTIITLLISASGIPLASLAYVASSTNYQVQTDSINSAGGYSSSASYQVEDTLGEVSSGTSSSAAYQVKAGYQQMQEVYLAVSLSGNVSLSPNIPSLGGGTANGSASWTVTTDNSAGYSMNLQASSSPALQSGANNFADYVPVGVNPDLNFVTPSSSSTFGFSPEGTDIVQRYKDDGAMCNTGNGDTASVCWDGLSTSPITIASSGVGNHPSGNLTTIQFRASSGASNVQAGGSYVATTTVTIIAL